MRKLIVLMIILLPVAVFSQKMVNGFGIEAYLGKTYTSPQNLQFRYEGSLYQANMTGQTDVFGGAAYFPFDMGIRRHRFTLAIGLEYRTFATGLGTNKNVEGSDGYQKNGLSLKSTTYSPVLQVLYRPHFYLGRLHMSFTVGANFKYAVANVLEICDDGKETIVAYNKNNTPTDDGYIDFGGNIAAERMRDLRFHVDPRIGFDFYIGNSFMISLFTIVPDVSSVLSTKSVKLEYGLGVTYLIRTNKITEAKILQQYKK